MINVSIFGCLFTEVVMSVSVVIPFYNAQKYLSEAIDSCLIQKEVSEIILVDDGSIDNSLLIANDYTLKHQCIILKELPKNLGRSAARNAGLALVSSEYFAFLDADDFFKPNRFERPMTHLKNNASVDMTYGATVTFNDNANTKRFEKITQIAENIAADKLFEYLIIGQGGHFCITSCTFRTKAIRDRYFFDRTLQRGEDTDFLWQIVRDSAASKINEVSPTTVRRIHKENGSIDEKIKYEQKFLLYQKWTNMLDHPKTTRSIEKKIHRSHAYYYSLLQSDNPLLQQWYKWKLILKK